MLEIANNYNHIRHQLKIWLKEIAKKWKLCYNKHKKWGDKLNDQGIYYFHQGTNYEAYRLLGAHYTKEATTFRVWAPNAKSVSVVGDFNGWNASNNIMRKVSNEGLFEAVIPGVKLYDCYQYAITSKSNKLIIASYFF